MRISLRLKAGWKTIPYDKNARMQDGIFICPRKACGEKLYIAPHGGIYCNAVHKS